MTGIVDWAATRARMVIAFIALSLLAGILSYTQLPKEGEPDIEIPAVFVSLPFPGISAEDSEKLLVKPMETELSDLDGLKTMTSTAAEGYAIVVLEFEFGWDKTKVLADVRDAMNKAEADFPAGAEQYTIDEFNFSQFPIIIVNLTGALPERTLLRLAKTLQDRLEGIEAVLEASLAGHRDEMVEVIIDPLRLEAYNVTAGELINVVVSNNQLIAAGEIETESGAFAVKIPSSFDEPADIYDLPVKTEGDRVITLGDIAAIGLTFEDRAGTARFNGEKTVALQVVKRKGFNIIDTVALVEAAVEEEIASWPRELQDAITVGTSNDQSRQVESMVSQLEGSVLTAVALVMIVVLAALGSRSALLVGFAIPTSFMLCFAFLAIMGVPISNIVMFGLILAVGMLVDGAIVVVEYADKRINEGSGPMHAYVEAAKRMFWPVVSSTATTLCAFLPMLFWPGVPGEFMGMLPVTLIFVLSASLVVALIYLPVMGGVAGRMSRKFEGASAALARTLPWALRAALVPVVIFAMFVFAMQTLNPAYLTGGGDPLHISVGPVLFILSTIAASIVLGAAKITRHRTSVEIEGKRTPFGHVIAFIAGNPVMPVVTIGAVILFVISVFGYFGQNNNGVEFFVESEPEQAIVYVRARGNLGLNDKDDLVAQVEAAILGTPGIDNAFAFAGAGGLNANTGGAQGPLDAIGQVQIELVPWEDRPAYARDNDIPLADLDGNVVVADLERRLARIPGIETEVFELANGPASAKPVHLRLKADNWENLTTAAEQARSRFEATPGLTDVEDNLPLPGIDWQIDVDVEKAGRYGADVATVGGMVQLVTRGILLDTMRVDSSDEEIEIRVRLPEEDRVLATLDTLKVRTSDGLVPLSNFISRKPVAELAQITRVDQTRYFDVKAGVEEGLVKLLDADGEEVARTTTGETEPGGQFAEQIATDGLAIVPINPNERIEELTKWLETDPLPAGVTWEWTGDQEDQEESAAFLQTGFSAALGLMFIILLAQFNSVYNAVLVLLAVVLSTTGVLIGMLVMEQPFSIIMTGTGIVALAGIVVNNNIVLIDTYQEYSKYMPRIEAIIRTAEARIRPVLLTTITTMAGLAPMMFGLSLDFIGGGYSIDSPTALWWKQLATAVVFGLGIATVLTLVFTPSMLALRVWSWTIAAGIASWISANTGGARSRSARDYALRRAAYELAATEIVWDVASDPSAPAQPALRAAE
ncbi:MAG: efflux RND transporter permease subunit [Silicimonas sp.]|nr:efflux RND transporter permease subunit [Silicimonas sp.]